MGPRGARILLLAGGPFALLVVLFAQGAGSRLADEEPFARWQPARVVTLEPLADEGLATVGVEVLEGAAAGNRAYVQVDGEEAAALDVGQRLRVLVRAGDRADRVRVVRMEAEVGAPPQGPAADDPAP
jgi:hypothetical protein